MIKKNSLIWTLKLVTKTTIKTSIKEKAQDKIKIQRKKCQQSHKEG